jgi:hypothetical protein
MIDLAWLLWFFGLSAILVPVVAYGWGYRRWGPPVPRFIQRRRATRGPSRASVETMDHHYTAFNPEGWGWGGDLLWFVLAIGVFSALATHWFRW